MRKAAFPVLRVLPRVGGGWFRSRKDVILCAGEPAFVRRVFLFVWMELPKEKQNIKWLILIRGFQPILDDKFDTFSLPEFKRTTNGASGLVERGGGTDFGGLIIYLLSLSFVAAFTAGTVKGAQTLTSRVFGL